MPVMNRGSASGASSKKLEIIVPGAAGSWVQRMFSGMSFSRTGKMDSSLSTSAPM